MTQRSENWKEFFIHVLTIFKVKITKTTTLKKRFRNVMVITNSKLCEVCFCRSFFSWINDHLRRYSKHSTVSKSISLYVDNHFIFSLLLSSGSRLKQSIFSLTVYYFSVSKIAAETLLLVIETLQDEFPGGLEGPRRDDGAEGGWVGLPPLQDTSHLPTWKFVPPSKRR